jgi:hypothetical protein
MVGVRECSNEKWKEVSELFCRDIAKNIGCEDCEEAVPRFAPFGDKSKPRARCMRKKKRFSHEYNGTPLYVRTCIQGTRWSRNSGPVVFHSHRKSGAVQKFWISCIAIIQQFWGGPEILDQLYCNHTAILGWSRNSGPNVFYLFKLKI